MRRRKMFTVITLLLSLYLGLGLAFHIRWQTALEACRQMLRARGAFVEPEVLGGPVGLFVDLTYWPVYAWANYYHDGTPFATPCTHPSGTNPIEHEHAGSGRADRDVLDLHGCTRKTWTTDLSSSARRSMM